MNTKSTGAVDRSLFMTPFHTRYWGLAARELKSIRVLAIAAVLTALRIAIKALTIPVGPYLNITFGFLVNSVGSMIYGPVVAVITSAISDTLGAVLFPTGTYFFPYIFEEIMGGVLFALFYYRARITTLRVMLGRFEVTVICNLLLNPFISIFYFKYVLGKSYTFFTLPRLIKNLALFPLQTLILVLLFNALLPFTNKQQLTFTGKTKIEIHKKDVIVLAAMTLASALFIVLYYWYSWKVLGKPLPWNAEV